MLFILTGDVQSGKTRWLERLVAELAADGVESRGVLAPGVWRLRADGDDGGPRPLGSGEGAYEKLGIDNVLLPQGERLRFARRRDLAERDGQLNPASQSTAAQLAWEIPGESLSRVNAHFEMLAKSTLPERRASDGAAVSTRFGQRAPDAAANFPHSEKRSPDGQLFEKAANVSCKTFIREEGEGGAAAPAAGENAYVPAAGRTVAAACPWLLVVDELGRLELERGCGLTAALDLVERGPVPGCPHALVVVRARLRDRAEERFAAAWGGCEALAPGDGARKAVRRAFGLASLIDNEYH
ncbi:MULTISPECIES: hypothetical protein [Gordonibacter]|uniref:hypothetical protein n=1 Tax=Gordonibacter TaxID=644652 RepID=UPI001DBD169F|nr:MULTISPECIES: hypothetical protein [Gordonibacter]MDN4510030.1 hypothetical protein [Gordonibacter sp. RACS_AR49]HJF63384.1 hypothetical protein [Gordonibacter urolithinfaciens]